MLIELPSQSKKKKKMPTFQEFYDRKNINKESKKEPVWEYLEREMRENIDKKPYNKKVGEWLKFLHDYRHHLFVQAKKKERTLNNEVGPPWYIELSNAQIAVLSGMKPHMQQDLLEDKPSRIRKDLADLGILIKFSKKILISSMDKSAGDVGIFIWTLYSAYYKKLPCELQPKYDINAMILLSSLVFIDLEECTDNVKKLMVVEKPPPPPPEAEQPRYFQPDVQLGEYLQKNYVRSYSPRDKMIKDKRSTKPTVAYKFNLRSPKSLEDLLMDTSFLEKRKERNVKELVQERKCNYKFWDPPLRGDREIAAKTKMLKIKTKPKFLKLKKYQLENETFHIGTVTYTGSYPHFILNNFTRMPTGYIPINGGVIRINGEYMTYILGFWKYPKHPESGCDHTCNCLNKWDTAVMDYMDKTQCKCHHRYDFRHEPQPPVKFNTIHKYIHKPKNNCQYWIDEARVMQMDPVQEFIKDRVEEALLSGGDTPPVRKSLTVSGMPIKQVLEVVLADLAHTPLIIPHLPEANHLRNLQEVIRRRLKGKITAAETQKNKIKTSRRLSDLKQMEFKALSRQIPFTSKEKGNMTYGEIGLMQKLAAKVREEFVSKNKALQQKQARLMWSTMYYDTYPSKAFKDSYFTLMPARMNDTLPITPYSPAMASAGGKTCHLVW